MPIRWLIVKIGIFHQIKCGDKLVVLWQGALFISMPQEHLISGQKNRKLFLGKDKIGSQKHHF